MRPALPCWDYLCGCRAVSNGVSAKRFTSKPITAGVCTLAWVAKGLPAEGSIALLLTVEDVGM